MVKYAFMVGVFGSLPEMWQDFISLSKAKLWMANFTTKFGFPYSVEF